jgi:hypothetical protein
VARNSAEALRLIGERRSKVSLKQGIGGQSGGGLKP